MKKIEEILSAKLSKYNNNEHYGFIYKVLELCVRYDAKKQKIEKEYLALAAAFAKENDLLDPVRKSEYTEAIQISNVLRTSLYKGLENLAKVNLKSPDKTIVESAKRLKALFDSRENISRKSYNVRTSMILDTLYEINKDYTADITNLSAELWVTKLDEENKNFTTLVDKRVEESIARGSDKMIVVRAAVDSAYAALVTRQTALMIIEEPDKFYPFVKELNKYIKNYNEHVKLRTTLNKNKQLNISTAQLSSIPDQTYNGNKIIPSVEILYTNPKTNVIAELDEDRDYVAICTNNRQPGTATLSLHGKGIYSGKIVTTFNIVMPPIEEETEGE
jgi:hypothetical protein